MINQGNMPLEKVPKDSKYGETYPNAPSEGDPEGAEQDLGIFSVQSKATAKGSATPVQKVGKADTKGESGNDDAAYADEALSGPIKLTKAEEISHLTAGPKKTSVEVKGFKDPANMDQPGNRDQSY